jgi:23S rRNA (uridine2479-2'-O)-methyltransferase
MPRTIRVNTANNDFQHAEVLRRNRTRRQQSREFFLEGVRPINSALEHGWNINSLYFAPELGLSDWAKNIINRSRAPIHYELSPALMRALSGKTDTSELVALVAMPDDQLSRIPIHESALVVVFDRPSSPGNLGTLIRSCDALRADGLIMTGHSVDLYDPETISASRGSLFALPTVRVPGADDLRAWIEETRARLPALQIVGSDESADSEVWSLNLRPPSILLIGNEKWGLSAGLRDLAEITARIPMEGSASSLNVACAASIVLYEVERQRARLRD